MQIKTNGIVLNFIANSLLLIIGIPALLVSTIISLCKHEGNSYYKSIAIGKDHFGNVLIAPIANILLIKKGGYKFGNIKESISGVLGKNLGAKTCTKLGLLICKFLDLVQKNHVEISVDNNV